MPAFPASSMDPAAGTKVGIPAHLARIILLRVPLRSLFRMKCVCMEWNSLISDPPFACDYRTRAPPPFAGYFIQAEGNPALGQLHFVAASDWFNRPNPILSFDRRRCRSAPSKVTILASSGGLLLCSSKSQSYFVCEPLTGRWRYLPPPPSFPKFWVVGFVHREDPPNRLAAPPRRSYRVVRLFYHSVVAMGVETYCSDAGEWKASVVTSYWPFSTHPFDWRSEIPAVALDGTLHWVNAVLELAAYNADDGSFRWVQPPPYGGHVTTALAVTGGWLSWYYKDNSGFDLWVLEDHAGGRWEHRHRVEFCHVEGVHWEGRDRIRDLIDPYVRGFDPGDPRLAVLDVPSMLLEYDMDGGTTRVLRDTNDWRHNVFPYFWPSWCFDDAL